MRVVLACGVALCAALVHGAAGAADWSVPPRGSPERTDILDALRPLADWSFGKPVEFVVDELRVSGGVAFVVVTAQRPGGGGIDVAASPMVTRDGEEPALIDGPRIEALMQRSGRMWVPVHAAVGSTDVWYSGPAFCPVWKPVLPESCGK